MCMQTSFHRWRAHSSVIAGAMSGTSLDGVDAAIVRIIPQRERTTIELLGTGKAGFSSSYRAALLQAIEGTARVAEIIELGTVLMNYYRQAIEEAIASSQVRPEAIGIHGQTLWHQPIPHQRWGVECRATFQLAVPSVLAVAFGVPIVSDFRSTDVQLGGQGAPLAPILDWELLQSPDRYVVALNIGGIANITLLPPNASLDRVQAFDTGPGNIWIDRAMHRYWGKPYDEDGKTAASGQVVTQLAAKLQTIPFITASPPKSTGRELFSSTALEEFIIPFERQIVPAEDIVATLTWFTAWSIAENIRRFAVDNATIVIAGGGAYNRTLCAMLHDELPRAQIVTLQQYCGIPEHAKEAVLMAYLAFRTLAGLPSNVPSVTGAQRAAVLGCITPPP